MEIDMSSLRSIIAVLACAVVAPVACGQLGRGDGDIPPITELLFCSYNVDPMHPPVDSDPKKSGGDYCNAAASGVVYVGEAKVWGPALASAASNVVGWKCKHLAVRQGANPCQPVQFEDEATLKSRVESQLLGGVGARHASVGGAQAVGSTVLAPIAVAVLAANSDSGATQTFAFPLPVASPAGPMIVPVSASIPVPTSNTAAVDQKTGYGYNSRVTEVNYISGTCAMQIGAGRGGRAKVTMCSAQFSSKSVCPTHGVSLPPVNYTDTWRSAQ